MTKEGSWQTGKGFKSIAGQLADKINSRRLRPLWITGLWCWGLFAIFRAGLLIGNYEHIQQVRAGDILKCFTVGFRYDATAISYFMLPMGLLLSLSPNRIFSRKWFNKSIVLYASALVSGGLLLEVFGAGFFEQYGVRPNWLAIDYIDRPQEVGAYIAQRYPLWIVPIMMAASFTGLYFIFTRVFWRKGEPTGPAWSRPIAAALILACCIVAARGSIAETPLRSGEAYFCDNKVITQATLNSFYTLANATKNLLNDNQGAEDLQQYPPFDKAARVVQEILTPASDAPAHLQERPFWRKIDTNRPEKDYNVVVIVMESMTGKLVGAVDPDSSQTPSLDAICKESLFFERMYAVADRTSRAMVGIFCGHPDLQGRSLMKRERSQGHFLTLPALFKQRGYRTLFVYGGDPEFDNMKAFFGSAGIERFIGEQQMKGPGLKSNWGFHDEVVFDKAHETFSSMGDEKFFSIILTTSNHKPFDVPTGRIRLNRTEHAELLRVNGLRYADWALGEFFAKAKRADYFKNTIFVLVADHPYEGMSPEAPLDVPGYRIPCAIYAPGIIEPARVPVTCSQVDIAPTILALLGGSYEHGFLGRNVLDLAEGEGFAVIREDDRLGVVRGDTGIVMLPGHSPMPIRIDALKSRPIAPENVDVELISWMEQAALAYQSVATNVYIEGLYGMASRHETLSRK